MDDSQLERMKEDSLSLHELMDRSCICYEMFSDHVADHPACDLVPEVQVLAAHIKQLMSHMYQLTGCAHFMASTDHEDPKDFYHNITDYDVIADLLDIPDDWYLADRDFEDWEEGDEELGTVNPEEHKRRSEAVLKVVARFKQKYIAPEKPDEHSGDDPKEDAASS